MANMFLQPVDGFSWVCVGKRVEAEERQNQWMKIDNRERVKAD